MFFDAWIAKLKTFIEKCATKTCSHVIYSRKVYELDQFNFSAQYANFILLQGNPKTLIFSFLNKRGLLTAF